MTNPLKILGSSILTMIFQTNLNQTLMIVTCIVCKTPVEHTELTNFALFSGLPNPCCKICFRVRDHTDKSIDTVIAKSLLRRAEMISAQKDNEPSKPEDK